MNTQYHAQSELGEYEYGYSNPVHSQTIKKYFKKIFLKHVFYSGILQTSSKFERKDSLGRVEGSYSYVSPDGRVVTNNYVADPATGFK